MDTSNTTLVTTDTAATQGEHFQLAQEQAATHIARLYVLKWSASNAAGQAHGLSAKAEWYARSQEHFVTWLSQGGFSSQGED